MKINGAARLVMAGLIACLGTGTASAEKAKRPLVAVMDFDYGTVHDHWWGNYDIGKGMADQVMNALVEDMTYRVVERKKLDTILAEQDFAHSDRAEPNASKLSKIGKVLGVKYIIMGSITKFSTEQNRKGVSVGGFGVGAGKAKTEVALSARMVDTSSGELVAVAKGAGESKKGGGFRFSKGGTGIDMDNPEFRASAIGEAQEAACKELVAAFAAKRDKLED